MPTKRLKEFLDANHVHYEVISHSPAYTAQEIAAVAHVPGREMVKTVILNVDGKMEMAVLPANERLDVKEVFEATGADRVRLAREEEFKELFPGCETGAMPALGNLYGIEVLMADSLAFEPEIFFNAGTHEELVRMSRRDFEQLAHPRVLHISA